MSKNPKSAQRARRTARALTAAVLPLVAAPFAVASTAFAAESLPDTPYSLAATVAPAPMTVAECQADASCEVNQAVNVSSVENHAGLYKAIARATAKTSPAVLDADGNVITPAKTATVLIPEGTYLLSRPLLLPPNVNLRGSGITRTTLTLDTAYWRNFGFIIRYQDNQNWAGASNLVSDLTVNGNCRIGKGQPDASQPVTRPGEICDFRNPAMTSDPAKDNTGGGISVADNWTVRQVRFTNLEYFKLWINNASNVHVIDNRWDNWGGAESHEEDNIGGGGGAENDNVVIEYNQWDRTIRGNSFDFTNAFNTVIRNNVVRTDNASLMSARKVGDYGSMFLEDVPGAQVTGNLLVGGHIILQSNVRYDHTYDNKDVGNARDTLVANNEIRNSHWAGITAAYEDYTDADGTIGTIGAGNSTGNANDHFMRPGGNNVFRDNLIVNPKLSGILIMGSRDEAKDAPDTVTGNRIVNAGFGGSLSYSTGAGTFDTTGIGTALGVGDKIYNNVIEDNQVRPTTLYGVHLGARKATTTTSGTVLSDPADPTGQSGRNTLVGNIPTLLRTVTSQAVETPTNLVATSNELTWKESTAMAVAPVAGYKVFRNGVQVADMPLGSVSVPGNLLTVNEASLEGGVAADYTAGSKTSVGVYNGAGVRGGYSLALTSATTGQISAATTRMIPVTPGQMYTSVSSYRAVNNNGHRARAGIVWFTADGTMIARMATSNYGSVDNGNGWTTSSYSQAAPANAAFAQVFVAVDETVPGEVHLVDRIGLVAGTNTESFWDPNGTAGARYHVVAYNQLNGEYSATAVLNN
ncbi:pectate lyase-like protein [Krasilnikovia cinnamomea]|uniref:Pectate lyase-like protein n=1 Tax=Krasilnikovia cinnamomea TaxID=349313 RepID=A0A4Q7ZFB7_9ACTN|nr:glycosyl hydrolase family 28-related protein [Krasilnikovia cinnamomea]RZU48679.1 pectate lyase-like protein [Krasilnikovia cinnamomea]